MDSKLTLHEFLTRALKPEIYQRKGQRFANHLHAIRPDLLDALTVRRLDPYHDDSLLNAAIAYVVDRWDAPEEENGLNQG